MDGRSKKIQQILVIILFLNLMVAFAKIVYGTLTDTLSMKSDGYHSLFDGVSNIVGIIAIFLAAKPPDRSHPYGHQKFETLASIIIAVLIIFVGFEIIHNSITRFTSDIQPTVTGLSFIVMIGTMAINLLVTEYERRKGEQLNSEILLADSIHTRSDIFVSLSVLVALVAIEAGFPIIDPLISLVIAAVIVRAGLKIIMKSSNTLCDAAQLEEEVICSLAYEVEGVRDCHKIRTRGCKGDIHIDLHIMVEPDLTVSEAHAISHRVIDNLKEKLKDVSEVLVHIDPFGEQK
ncbi:cation diffusion facilitator family transporter [Methanococcoides methylutens]|uniref:Cobalt-zinc-cadmium resistance protein n=1 Tax=Methanococcoides methylutens MM1 TaxID=1434104 RepID=A0A0E3X066_METMT|nr:cation diffusion facilitator family transporter [Methanococcoides methylutens]AKB85550.1 Cobalt-zinc-cadmium resistance protein [Methanococcoides methylutens MM1]